MSYNRINRISEEVKKELGEIVRELKDPRIPMMTSVVNVQVTRDLRYAKVYVSVMGDKEAQSNAIAGLKSAAGFMRKEIGKRVQLRYTPELLFILDESMEHGAYINRLLHNINASEGDSADNDTETEKDC
ncbi:30S ribosome-binding factor RbfA [Petroclostridium sp. X23]|uniref:30S ribosome-binding factor RbfA n=1 Tax=Petroclostridium sp. X23 TaxID=3045146 RepID=UPI0024ADE41E|nr:30S ribosome-binding factor RbfA [Petroclostridium sp. X23]WHH58980.1 30S ribosome-binding factor RbfA [Petroclostridium sp. X23]